MQTAEKIIKFLGIAVWYLFIGVVIGFSLCWILFMIALGILS